MCCTWIFTVVSAMSSARALLVARAARAFAQRHAGFSHERQTLDLCDAIEAVATTPRRREPAGALAG